MVANVGVHEKWTSPDNGRTPTEILAAFPGATLGRNAFINRSGASTPEDLRGAVQNRLQPFVDAGTPVVFLSIKTPISETRNGDWNSRYQELGTYLQSINTNPTLPTVKFLGWHEPENVFSSAGAFAHYQNKVREHVKNGGPDVEVGYCAMAYQWRPGSDTTSSPSAWRAVEHDFLACDVYSGRSFPLDSILPEHSGFDRWYDEIATHGVQNGKFVLTERGFETPNEFYPELRYQLRVDTINREFDWLRDDPLGQFCTDYIYWNSSGTEESAGLVLDPDGEAALAARVQEFANIDSSPPPELTQWEKGYAYAVNRMRDYVSRPDITTIEQVEYFLDIM